MEKFALGSGFLSNFQPKDDQKDLRSNYIASGDINFDPNKQPSSNENFKGPVNEKEEIMKLIRMKINEKNEKNFAWPQQGTSLKFNGSGENLLSLAIPQQDRSKEAPQEVYEMGGAQDR
jgi:hypothetical protein